ncbi:MAG: 30S ribosome-binding factor RbfA [Armatimonadota bacterium]|nr:30S ribosome-binding factor RbfA [bacterium]
MTTRQEKIQELLREEISDILRREFKDPRLGFITITGAEVTSDLRHAKVFVSVLGTEQQREENIAILKKGEHFVRAALGRRIHMKTLPEIDFRLDTSADKGIRIQELLEQIKHDED